LDRADLAYANRRGWAVKTIRAASNMWAFSSDRTIKEYAEKVWGVEPSPFKPPHHAQPPARRERADEKRGARARGEEERR
jgi:starch phosphorylase